jgi:hypothetical protein
MGDMGKTQPAKTTHQRPLGSFGIKPNTIELSGEIASQGKG